MVSDAPGRPISMSTPGWYPNPDGSDSMRYWDGQQWTEVAPKTAPPAAPVSVEPTLAERTAARTPAQKKSNRRWIIGGVAAFALIAIIGSVVNRPTSDDQENQAAATSQPKVASTSPLSPTPRAVAPAPAPAAATTRPAPTRPAPAQTATEAGCEEPDPSILSTIEVSLTEGRTIDQVAAVSTLIDGVEYIYTAGNVYRADGSRSVSGVVWVTPGFGVMGLSGNSREVSTLPFGRGILDVSAGDEYGTRVQDCVTALALGR